MSSLLSQNEGAQELVHAVQAGAAYAAGKLGTSEFDALCWYITHRQHKTAIHFMYFNIWS